MISIVIAFRIIDSEFLSLWRLTIDSIQGILNTMSEDFELIVVDNGSYSEEFAVELKATSVLWGLTYPRMEGFRILRFDEHVSLAKAWNEGVNQVDGEYIIMANNDIVYHQSGWETRMLDMFKTDPKMGIVGIQHMSWAYFSFVEGSLFMLPTAFRDEFNLGVSDEEARIELFDEQFMYIADVDLNKRVQDAGYKTTQVVNPPLQPMFLQHLSHRTINTLAHRIDFVKLTHEDRVKLCEKWGFDPQIND